jgi:trk system potassium uptake protein TrkH
MNVIFTTIHIFGLITIGFSALMATCLMTSFISHDGAIIAFFEGTGITLLLGALMFFPTLRIPKKVSRQTSFLLVSMTWSLIPVFCTLPLIIYMPEISYIDAYFEAVSGLTTTGATTLTGLDDLPISINLWRHELNWVGGMGIIILAVAILPILGIGGMQLYKAEAPGAVKESELPPRIAQTAKALWLVYAGFTLLCIIALRLAGMTWFDSVCHAFSAVSLGGFSTHDASIGFFDSPAIEMVLTSFQLLAAINFATHYIAIRKQTLRAYAKDMEARSFLALVLGSCLVAATVLWHAETYPDFITALRHAAFNMVTIATSSGYSSQDFNEWPIFVSMSMLFLSCISASSGSTGGGIRMIRTIILVKQSRLELYKFIHPFSIKPLKIGTNIISHNIVASVTGFIFLYFIIIVIMVFMMLLSGMDFLTAFTAVIASFNNTGPGLNQVGPAANYAGLNDFQTGVCIVAMLLGRVQIFSMIILFVPEFWKK